MGLVSGVLRVALHKKSLAYEIKPARGSGLGLCILLIGSKAISLDILCKASLRRIRDPHDQVTSWLGTIHH